MPRIWWGKHPLQPDPKPPKPPKKLDPVQEGMMFAAMVMSLGCALFVPMEWYFKMILGAIAGAVTVLWPRYRGNQNA
jgi:hypothetical protein